MGAVDIQASLFTEFFRQYKFNADALSRALKAAVLWDNPEGWSGEGGGGRGVQDGGIHVHP